MRNRNNSILAPKNTDTNYVHRLLVGIPTLGTVRMEWANAFNGIVIPTNFSNSTRTPIGFRTEDAQNLIVRDALNLGFKWVLFIEDDVIVPADVMIRFRRYIQSGKYPLVAGLYNLKGTMPEPMVYRGRGNGPFTKFKLGDKVECDGLPAGCTLIHIKLIKAVADISPTYNLKVDGNIIKLKKVFEAPRNVWTDPKLQSFRKLMGTSDLNFCDTVLKKKLLAKAGWKKLGEKKYPFIVDTAIKCGHIDRATGYVY